MTVSYMDECAVDEPALSAFAAHDAARSYARMDVADYLMTPSSPDWLARAKVQLNKFGRLPPNWNSYGARPVSALARTAAFGLLRELAGPLTPEPTLVPTSEGSVQIEWHTRGIDLEIRILSSTRIGISFEDLRGEYGPIEEEFQFDLTRLGQAIRILSNR